MAELINESDMRAMFDIHADVASGRLTRAIGAASRRLKSVVGADAYADALSGAPVNADRKEDLKLAEAHWCMHFAIVGLNTQIRSAGLVKTEKVEGKVTVQYLTPKEVRELGELYLDQAEEIARPYALADGTPAAPFEFAEVDTADETECC
ncbi:MAG: hypothetical protein AB7U82_33620 [Blastocatellales bacterium]